ncbi:TPA: hypothetical protein ACQJO7_003925 [Vibrio parahaemolyticus]|nr:hypothetical protein [Vibrio parahaemolyticus]
MSNKSSIAAPTIANGSAALLGAVAIDFASGLEPPLKDFAIYVVPALTLCLAFVFNFVASLAAMSVSEKFATSSSKDYFDELKAQIDDPLIKPEVKEQRIQEYNDALDTRLAMKKGKFSLFSSAHEQATKRAQQTMQNGVSKEDQDAIAAQTQQFQQAGTQQEPK